MRLNQFPKKKIGFYSQKASCKSILIKKKKKVLKDIDKQADYLILRDILRP